MAKDQLTGNINQTGRAKYVYNFPLISLWCEFRYGTKSSAYIGTQLREPKGALDIYTRLSTDWKLDSAFHFRPHSKVTFVQTGQLDLRKVQTDDADCINLGFGVLVSP